MFPCSQQPIITTIMDYKTMTQQELAVRYNDYLHRSLSTLTEGEISDLLALEQECVERGIIAHEYVAPII